MKTRLLTFVLSLSAVGMSLSADAETVSADPLYQEIAVRSEWWPERVKLTEDVALSTEKGTTTLKKGRPAIFVAPVEDGAWIDFGNYGVIKVPYASTDIAESVARNKHDRDWQSAGNLSVQLSNKFFWPESLQQISPWTFKDADYLLISYLDLGSEVAASAQRALVASHSELEERCPRLFFVTIALDPAKDEMMKDLAASGISWPVMFFHMSAGYVNALHHQPLNPTAVLVDKNGRVLARWGADEIEAGSFSANVERAVEGDLSLRESLKN
ncbi:hypothetical protein H5P28_11285 [Ruficoccus amylovorans]|uniref:Thioredoxin domain-containing protein n=1 Tax=Ruficoccus amylovorans TaxID=1804625 RepID=A0A842HEI5_9BACT|nr:hypothetical protein [Ruficoccus amylovorans]MBC2594842.1 hypothetical protein [Ruficoccus amylovorans]